MRNEKRDTWYQMTSRGAGEGFNKKLYNVKKYWK